MCRGRERWPPLPQIFDVGSVTWTDIKITPLPSVMKVIAPRAFIIYLISLKDIKTMFSMSQHSTENLLKLFLTTLIKQILLLLVSHVYIKEKYENE